MKTENNGIRIGMMLLGILLISFSVACLRLAGFGVDAFTGLNLGISGFIGWSFGTWQLIANIIILIVVFFTVRHCIGIGTVINMIGVGYIADFICWLVQNVLQLELAMPARIVIMLMALLFASLGVALYMTANMGIAPYDSVALIIEKLTNEKIPFHIARISSDITALLIGIFFWIAKGNNIWSIIGFGTICNALFNGPMIKYFQEKLQKYKFNDRE